MPDPIRDIVERMRRLLPSERPVSEYDIPEQLLHVGDRPHLLLNALVEQNRQWHVLVLRMLLTSRDDYRKIPINPLSKDSESTTPSWRNCDLPTLDALTLYGFLTLNAPKRYIELGSGESTRFARRAVRDHHLETEITSMPAFVFSPGWFEKRAQTMEGDLLDMTIFSTLEEGDILRVATYRVSGIREYSEIMQYVIPNICPGVSIQLQDIFLPSGISPDRSGGSQTDQHLVAEMIRTGDLDVVLPCSYVALDEKQNAVTSPITEDLRLEEDEMQGRSLWVRTR